MTQRYILFGLGFFLVALADAVNGDAGSTKDLRLWGKMALVGFLVCFVLAIWPVIKGIYFKIKGR